MLKFIGLCPECHVADALNIPPHHASSSSDASLEAEWEIRGGLRCNNITLLKVIKY